MKRLSEKKEYGGNGYGVLDVEFCQTEPINRRRVMVGLAAVIVVTMALAGRLFYIQVLCHEEFKETAAIQYELAIDGLDTRGQIFDRNMEPLTGGTYQYYYIIKTAAADAECEELLAQTDAENVTAGAGREAWQMQPKYQVFRTEQYIENVSRQLHTKYGAYIFRSRARYTDEQIACHLIGYLNDSEKKGVSGLELFCEERLQAADNRLVLLADAAGNILPGKAPYVSSKSGQAPVDNSVVTSIDAGLQRKCESLLDGSAACVVSDADTGEILAMASAPGFNPNKIADYLDTDSDCLMNKAIQGAYAPGSVFKLVVAAAALENGVCAAARTFECTGGAEVGGVTIACATAPPGGHGTIDMYEAMAKSCNCYFVQLGQLIGKNRILAMARNLGLGKTVLNGFPEESGGNIPDNEEVSDQDISNISIGQGALLTTPVQINRLTAVIASGGKNIGLSLFQEAGTVSSEISTLKLSNRILTDSGIETEQLLSPETASALQTMMRGVVTEGTASGTAWTVPTWAKTGTAEASLRGQPAKNCWLTGFCRIPDEEAEAVPGENADKCYVITVFVEDGVSGSASALPIFKKIVDYLDNCAG